MKDVYFLFVFYSSILAHNSFLQWAQHYAKLQNQTACGVLSSTAGLSWWISPIQGTDWHSLYNYISEIIHNDIMFRDQSITNQNVFSWPMINRTWNLPGHNQTFSYHQTIKILTDFTNPQIDAHQRVPKLQNPTYRYTEDGTYQIWDAYLWLTPTTAQLSQKAILCWEQRNHTYDTWVNSTRHLGWLPSEACSQTIVLQTTDWFATDWRRRPGIRWLAPNGTHWLCGTNLWPWLPPGWIGR